MLPPHVVAALCRLRDCEHDTVQWKHWCMWLDTQESNQKLPKPLDSVAEITASTGRPSVAELLDEVNALVSAEQTKSTFDAIVIAGEGEPTLRLAELLDLVKHLKDDESTRTVRVTTNGLAVTDDCAAQLHSAGVDAVSVALMTHDPALYDELMRPLHVVTATATTAHERVCSFLQQAVSAGLSVEVTGVDRSEVNKSETEALAASLGVRAPVRWRSHHP